MKTLFFIAAFLSVMSSAYGQQKSAQNFNKLYWLVGAWTSTGNKPGESGTETWVKTSATKLTGKGITLRGADTVFLEKLSLEIKGDDVYYIADVTGNKEPVPFKLIDITDDSFDCENPEHDFPKKISYKLVDGHVEASISGDGKTIPYSFDRIK